MDCLSGLQLLNDNCIDLTITSPPYDNLRSYTGYSFDFESIADELLRVTKDGSVIVWVVGDATINGSETGTSFKQALYFKKIGFNLHDTMIYEKIMPLPFNHNRYEPTFEYMFILSKGRPNVFNPLMEDKLYLDTRRKGLFHRGKTNKWKIGVRNPDKTKKIKGNIWGYRTGLYHSSKDKLAFEHPAIFPEKLVADHIKSWSNPGDVILDIFMGSGTTAKVARDHQREYIGFEISKKYCAICERRLQQLVIF